MSPENKSIPSIIQSFAKIVEPHPKTTDINARQKSQFTAALSLAIAFLYFAGAVTAFIVVSRVPGMGLVLCLVGLISLLCYAISRTKFFQVGAVLLMLVLLSSVYFFIFSGTTDIETILYTSVPVVLILSSILLNIPVMLILLASVLISILLLPMYTSLIMADATKIAGVVFVFGILLTISSFIRERFERERMKATIEANQRLRSLQENLASQVEERTQQVRTVADVAQSIISAITLDELLNRTTTLIVERLNYYHSGIFLIDEAAKYAVLRAAKGPTADQLLSRDHKLEIGSPSIIGWVTANKQSRVASNVIEDPIHLKNELLPETQAEIGIPIMIGDMILGVLDVQSVDANAFNPETVINLQTLADQIASAIQNIRLIEASHIDLDEVADIYSISNQIAQAQTEAEVFEKAGRALRRSPYICMILSAEQDHFRIVSATAPLLTNIDMNLPDSISVSPEEMARLVGRQVYIGEMSTLSHLPTQLLEIIQQMRLVYVALLPTVRANQMMTLLIMGTTERNPIETASIRPYTNVSELITNSLERINISQQTERRMNELEILTDTSQRITGVRDLLSLYEVLHKSINQIVGDTDFLIALYEPATSSIRVPYVYERGEVTSVEAFPLGEGLTSILLRSGQPLMLVEDTERKAVALGAKVVGLPAKSWLGTPLIVRNEPIGAIIIQDTEHEHAFDESDLRFVSTLAAQVAGAIHNAYLLDEMRKRTIQLQTAAEIARDISGSLDLNQLLNDAVNKIQTRFGFYHAAVFLIDPSREYAVIREATGEAGMQMKHSGHKLGVGSKSIVGYVTSSGEPLVVNDTVNNTTYYANPLLPNTRAEATIPLRVGSRIIGALDFQSSSPFSFLPEDINVLRILADQLAVAIINSELFAETQEHLSQHRLLHHVTTAAASGSTLEEALSGAVQGLQVTLGGDRVSILLADKDRKVLIVKSAIGYPDEVMQLEIPYNSGITGWVASHLRPLRVDDVTKDPRYVKVGADVRSELAVPMVYRGELLGILNVESEQVSAYSENDEEMLGTLGGSLAAIIANTRLLEQIRHQIDRERLLYEVTSKIRRSTDMETIMETTTSELSKALGAQRARIKISPQGKGNPGEASGTSPDKKTSS